VIFGLMDVLNLAHGSFYMVGAYVAYTLVQRSGNFWLAFVAAPLLLAALGALLEVAFFRRLYRHGHLLQVLLTFGVSLVLIDVMRSIYGPATRGVPPPPGLGGAVHFGLVSTTKYSLFLLGLSLAIGACLVIAWRTLKVGAILRAGVDDKEMVGLLGINLGRVFTATFAFGAALAGLAGVVAAPEFAIYPNMDDNVLILALVVVVLGGLGSVEGALIGAFVVGIASSVGIFYFQQVAIATVFAVMAIVLVIRPRGLLGRRV
jgi:branched-subunit amino acid ABC-type transport system permease component